MKKALILAIFVAGALTGSPVFAISAPPAGTLVKSANRQEIYYVASDNRRYRFPNMETLQTWYPDNPTIATLEKPTDLARIRDSRAFITVRPGRTLVKFADSPKVYAVENGAVLHWLQTERDAYRTYGLAWQSKVVTLPASDRALYTFGYDIYGTKPFPRLAATQRAFDIEQELRDRQAITVPPAGLASLGENLKGSMFPRFSPTIHSYTLAANRGEETLLLTPASLDPAAAIRVKDITLASGDTARIPLFSGDNTIPLSVANIQYSILVRRAK